MPMSIGVNLRVTGHCNQGGRKYMEDMFSVAYQQSSNDRELEYAFFGIFDGHGGGEAATFAKENLMDIIVKQKNFWSDNDEDVLKAIRDGYVNTHYAMWRELDKWPRTASGLPSTAGTTASIAFIRKGKIYIGHVGDSAIILGYQEKDDPAWRSKALTRDHKPECGTEMLRIQESGGKVVSKSGVPRVVWNRPRLGHKGPVRRSTHIDEIPFLAVARSLGDLWSYNSELNTFVVSPEPDVKVVKIDVKTHRCLIFGTDGLWNMLTPDTAVAIVQAAEKHNEKHLIASQQTGHGQEGVQMWINPSKSLVDRALDRWTSTRLRADNTSVVTLMLDPPGPTHSEILLSQRREQMAAVRVPVHPSPEAPIASAEQLNNVAHSQHSNAVPRSTPNSVEPKARIPTSTPTTAVHQNNFESQKQPDSSNHMIDHAANFGNPSKAHFSSCPVIEIEPLNQNYINAGSTPQEESIQVAEISSSNASDENNDSSSGSASIEEQGMLRMEVESTEAILEVENSIESSMIDIAAADVTLEDTKFLLEKKSWLQQVPVAEQYANDTNNVHLQPIKFHEPSQGPRLRRSTPEGPMIKRVVNSSPYGIIRRIGRRRHSTGAPINTSRQQQRQRRSLTPKSSAATANYSSSGNKIKRNPKVSLVGSGFEEPRVGVGTKNSSDCKYDTKDPESEVLGEELSLKRRTRSEDRRNMQDENNPANQKVDQHSRLRWHGSDSTISISRTNGILNSSTGSMQERRLSSPNSFKRRNLEKKVTPVKTIRRPSINRSTSRIQMRESFWDQGRASRTGVACSGSRRQTVVGLINSGTDSVNATTTSSSSAPKRWLRSDTIAATPIKTLRSRNVDIAGHTVPAQLAQQYDKPNRIQEPGTKLKLQPTTTPETLTNTSPSQPTGVAKLKPIVCTPASASTATPNRTKQNCSIAVNNSASCISANSSSTSSSSISKRAKTPYNPSARSLSTRSRIKRFSK